MEMDQEEDTLTEKIPTEEENAAVVSSNISENNNLLPCKEPETS